MKKLYFVFGVLALLASSCVKDLEQRGNGGTVTEGTISPDFAWKTVRDMKATVAVPTVNGATVDYAVVRIYSSPILVEENIVAQGVTKPSSEFNTTFTVPTGVKAVYVQTTLPDGTKSVKMVPVQSSAAVAGTAFERASAPKIRVAEEKLRESSMPAYPVMEPKTETDFSGQAIIRSIESGKNYQLGASWSHYAAAEYYIPAGVEIKRAIDLNGGFQPYPDPVLYVAGKLTMSNLGIGRGRLVVLPGGVVTVESLTGNGSSDTSNPSIYVFEGGKIVMDKANLGNRTIVNCGQFIADDDLVLNNSVTFYNTPTARIETDKLDLTNNVTFYNDGLMNHDELTLDSNTQFFNCENGDLKVEEMSMQNANSAIFHQRGKAKINELTGNNDVCKGEIYVNCYTYIEEIHAEQTSFYLSAGVCLESEEVVFNNTSVSMASGSLFITEKYNDVKGDTAGNNRFTSTTPEGQTIPVVFFEKFASYTIGNQWWSDSRTVFDGRMEVVDPSAENKIYVAKCFTNGSFLTYKQITDVPATECTGGHGTVVPDVEPEPAPDFGTVTGATYTYCFEDRWPYLGDYDLNDVVVVSRIDRNLSKDGSKVASLTFNWELKAAGTTVDVACGVQMDNVKASRIASVESSYKGFGSGVFADQGLEAGQEYAVIPFFNKTSELLVSSNTWPGHPVAATTKHTTKVVFAEPVAVEEVLDTKMNFFIVVESREAEIHMPTYQPTSLGNILTGDNHLSDQPYKAYVPNSNRPQDNYMMWALMIPGEFRYPAENKDIRKAYPSFLPWAASNGTQHEEWYLEEYDKQLVF